MSGMGQHYVWMYRHTVEAERRMMSVYCGARRQTGRSSRWFDSQLTFDLMGVFYKKCLLYTFASSREAPTALTSHKAVHC